MTSQFALSTSAPPGMRFSKSSCKECYVYKYLIKKYPATMVTEWMLQNILKICRVLFEIWRFDHVTQYRREEEEIKCNTRIVFWFFVSKMTRVFRNILREFLIFYVLLACSERVHVIWHALTKWMIIGLPFIFRILMLPGHLWAYMRNKVKFRASWYFGIIYSLIKTI